MNRQQKIVRKRSERLNPFIMVIIVALVIIAIAGLIVYLTGYRYISIGENKYTGFVKDGIPVDGTIKYSDKNTGELKVDVDRGICTIKYSNGDTYKGGIKGISREGKGVLTVKKSGYVFEGTFKNDRLTGDFVVRNADGELKYEGTLRDGKMHGIGKFYGDDGSYYYGNFENGKRHGAGEERKPDGTVYYGTFISDKRQGSGVVTVNLANGGVYTGECKIIFSGGEEYVGDFFNDKMHGNGVYTWKDGSTYKGEFANGKPHGEGTYDGKNGRPPYTGKFFEGQPVVEEVQTVPAQESGI